MLMRDRKRKMTPSDLELLWPLAPTRVTTFHTGAARSRTATTHDAMLWSWQCQTKVYPPELTIIIIIPCCRRQGQFLERQICEREKNFYIMVL